MSEPSQPLLCHKLFGYTEGEGMRGLVQQTTGQLCPCLQGIICPLLDALGWSPLLTPGDELDAPLVPRETVDGVIASGLAVAV